MKDILVHLDGSGADETRITHASALADTFAAHLTGLLLNIIPTPVFPTEDGVAYAAYLDQTQAAVRTKGDQDEERLLSLLKAHTALARLVRRDLFNDAVWSVVAKQARVSDLFVALQPYGANAGRSDVVESALFESGRAIYVVPTQSSPTAALRSVLIAWNDTPGCAHAVAEAMPVLMKAEEVAVVTIDGADDDSGEVKGATGDIVSHLMRCGITAELRHVGRRGCVSDTLLDEVDVSGTDLLVMGGYGHSRLREWIIGGATRDCLMRCPVPILLAH